MMKIRFLAIFAAVLTLHVFVEGGLVKPEYKYDCYWKVANASDRVCRNHDQDECVGEIGQNDDPLICLGCTHDVIDKLNRWQSG
uniref:Putative secreted protein n=1 Tax=Ixodes scapularis TaxID=6945 RepID=Q4PN14_IXOSC|nr:putative secreted protein [Ixodes scapularis]